jgi:hypothetical protein
MHFRCGRSLPVSPFEAYTPPKGSGIEHCVFIFLTLTQTLTSTLIHVQPIPNPTPTPKVVEPIIKQLVAANASLDRVNKERESALSCATSVGNLPLVELLLFAGTLICFEQDFSLEVAMSSHACFSFEASIRLIYLIAASQRSIF